jgi:hypothetical protein
MLRHQDPKKKSGWTKAPRKEIKTIIDSGNLNNNEQANPNDIVVSIAEKNKIKHQARPR